MKKNQNVKVVIPCAGNGTRMQPWAMIPKELLPVESEGVVKPILVDLIHKCYEVGLSNVSIVVNDEKRAIREYFEDDTNALIEKLENSGKTAIANAVAKIPKAENLEFINQKGPYGNNTPLASLFFDIIKINDKWTIVSEKPVSAEWILYVFPDDLFLTSGKNEIQQILDAHKKYGGSILPSKRSQSDAERNQYAFCEGQIVEGSNGKAVRVSKIIEKPGDIPLNSDLASVKGYLLKASDVREQIRTAIEEYNEASGEFMIQDAVIQPLIDAGKPFFAVKIDGEYHDTGNPTGYKKYWKSLP